MVLLAICKSNQIGKKAGFLSEEKFSSVINFLEITISALPCIFLRGPQLNFSKNSQNFGSSFFFSIGKFNKDFCDNKIKFHYLFVFVRFLRFSYINFLLKLGLILRFLTSIIFLKKTISTFWLEIENSCMQEQLRQSIAPHCMEYWLKPTFGRWNLRFLKS